MYRRCSVLVASALLAIIASRVRAQNNSLQPLSTWGVMEVDSGGHQALIMIFGTPERPVARRVMIRVDANGSAYDYLDARRDPVTDSATTSIQLDLTRQTGMLQNIVGGQAQFYRVTGGKLASAESLGRPDSMIARVVRECGKKP